VKTYIFLGAPGVGKGTMAERLSHDYDFIHISTGDLLRREIEDNSELGLKAKNYIDSGWLVPDEIVTDIVSQRLKKLGGSVPGIILDGFPRTVEQASSLDQVFTENQIQMTAVILFEADEDLLVKRLSARWICRECGAIFNTIFSPPREPGKCDRCGSRKLYQRSDDQESTVRDRLQVYRKETAPLIDYYEQKRLLRRVSGTGTPEKNYQNLLEVLK